MVMKQENQSKGDKEQSQGHFAYQNPTRFSLRSNPSICNEKPVTNRLTHDRAPLRRISSASTELTPLGSLYLHGVLSR